MLQLMEPRQDRENKIDHFVTLSSSAVSIPLCPQTCMDARLQPLCDHQFHLKDHMNYRDVYQTRGQQNLVGKAQFSMSKWRAVSTADRLRD